MNDKIAEICKRSAFANENKSVISPTGFSWTIPGWQAHNDRAFLLSEVDKQRAEIERLRAEMIDLAEWCETEEPLSYKHLSYRLRAALEAKP